MPGEPKRTAQSIIAEAIRENKLGENLLYFFSGATFLIGAVVLSVGVYRGAELISIIGALFSAIFYPAMRSAKNIRDQNLAIRLMEIPLNNAKTAEEAALILKRFFEATIPATSRDDQKGKPKS